MKVYLTMNQMIGKELIFFLIRRMVKHVLKKDNNVKYLETERVLFSPKLIISLK